MALHFCAIAQYDKIVAADGTGDYTTISAAILAAPGNPTIPFKIFIKNGIYKEKVTINRTFITLVGESAANVIIRWDDYYFKVANLQPKSTATVTINANDVVMMNITVENRSANTTDGPQALALNVNRDRCAFKNCRFIGGQDTVCTDRNGTRQYFKDCYIDGNTDFIYGGSTALFDNCILYPRDRLDGGGGGYVTAANTPVGQTYGYVFRNCIIPVNNGTTTYTLGRPWGNDAGTADANKANNKTVFINTIMGQSISPAGWSVWDNSTITSLITYAEYNSLKNDGSPVDINSRVTWSKQLTSAQADNYTTANILTNTSGAWNPCSISADFCNPTAAEIAVSNFRIKKGANSSKISCNLNFPIEQVRVELFRSQDNSNFVKVAESILSSSNFNFNFTDNLPGSGISYYYKILASKTGLNTFNSELLQVDGAVALPLTLISFKAILESENSSNVKLVWKTTDERNTLQTVLERSENGIDFNPIISIKTNNTLGFHEYSFLDKNVNISKAYYRLKMVDLDGVYNYSHVIVVNLAVFEEFMVYPNPVSKGAVTIKHPLSNANAYILVNAISGQTLMNLKVGLGAVITTVDLSSLNRGIYMLTYVNNTVKNTIKMVIP